MGVFLRWLWFISWDRLDINEWKFIGKQFDWLISWNVKIPMKIKRFEIGFIPEPFPLVMRFFSWILNQSLDTYIKQSLIKARILQQTFQSVPMDYSHNKLIYKFLFLFILGGQIRIQSIYFKINVRHDLRKIELFLAFDKD